MSEAAVLDTSVEALRQRAEERFARLERVVSELAYALDVFNHTAPTEADDPGAFEAHHKRFVRRIRGE